ncbi:MAG TPA: ABC transporter substrate-binding protein, partial [Propionibacteriaceae bacterium]|nr:ABC transporter substrate-binding protein [Propionibacteriaceae bacterium]
NGDYDITIVAHVEPRDINKFADPTYYWHYNNPAFQALIAKADTEPTEAAWLADMADAQKVLTDDAAAVWLFMLPNLVVTKNTVTGLSPNAVTLSFDLTGVARR